MTTPAQMEYTSRPRVRGGGVVMDGGIYTREKCSICGKVMRYNGRWCSCPDHPTNRARTYIVKFPGGIYKTFVNLTEAEQELNHLRHEKAERGRDFNPDDYRSLRPNSFAALAPKYLEVKRQDGLRSIGKVSFMINAASAHFGRINLRDITGGMIADYLRGIPGISQKTRHNHMAQLRNFWRWCLSRGDVITLAEFPAFPDIKYELGYRKILTWELQEKVLNKLKEIAPPKVWLGCDMLATYTALRPDDLRRIREGDFDGEWIHLCNPTKLKNRFKHIHLHQDHVAAWKGLQREYPAMPDMPFFRHHGKVRGTVRRNLVFGPRHLSDWWNKACKALGISGVPLYPGTKHTTATETAKMLGADRALKASGLTNKAFDRYCQVENTDAYEVVREIRERKKGEVVPMKRMEEK